MCPMRKYLQDGFSRLPLIKKNHQTIKEKSIVVRLSKTKQYLTLAPPKWRFEVSYTKYKIITYEMLKENKRESQIGVNDMIWSIKQI